MNLKLSEPKITKITTPILRVWGSSHGCGYTIEIDIYGDFPVDWYGQERIDHHKCVRVLVDQGQETVSVEWGCLPLQFRPQIVCAVKHRRELESWQPQDLSNWKWRKGMDGAFVR